MWWPTLTRYAKNGSPEQKTYLPLLALPEHTDWVRDVSWSPSGLLKSYIASGSQDKTVKIWTCAPDSVTQGTQGSEGEWKATTLEFESVVWRVSWSLSGNVLAVSQGDNKVGLWRESVKGEWEKVREIDE